MLAFPVRPNDFVNIFINASEAVGAYLDHQHENTVDTESHFYWTGLGGSMSLGIWYVFNLNTAYGHDSQFSLMDGLD